LELHRGERLRWLQMRKKQYSHVIAFAQREIISGKDRAMR